MLLFYYLGKPSNEENACFAAQINIKSNWSFPHPTLDPWPKQASTKIGSLDPFFWGGGKMALVTGDWNTQRLLPATQKVRFGSCLTARSCLLLPAFLPSPATGCLLLPPSHLLPIFPAFPRLCTGLERTAHVSLHAITAESQGRLNWCTSMYWPNYLRGGIEVLYGTFMTPLFRGDLGLCP